MSVTLGPLRSWHTTADQPLPQLRPSPPRSASLDCNSKRLPLSDEDYEALASRHPRIDQIPLQHRVVLRRQWDDHGRIFRALALVDCRCVGEHQLIKLTKAIGDFTPLEV